MWHIAGILLVDIMIIWPILTLWHINMLNGIIFHYNFRLWFWIFMGNCWFVCVGQTSSMCCTFLSSLYKEYRDCLYKVWGLFSYLMIFFLFSFKNNVNFGVPEIYFKAIYKVKYLLKIASCLAASQLTVNKNLLKIPSASIYGCQLSMYFGKPPAEEYNVTYNLSSFSRNMKVAAKALVIHRSSTHISIANPY